MTYSAVPERDLEDEIQDTLAMLVTERMKNTDDTLDEAFTSASDFINSNVPAFAHISHEEGTAIIKDFVCGKTK